jgi:hypothetical protein
MAGEAATKAADALLRRLSTGWREGDTYAGLIADAFDAFAADALDQAAALVDAHPDESETCQADPEYIRGCCEVMAEEIRLLKRHPSPEPGEAP